MNRRHTFNVLQLSTIEARKLIVMFTAELQANPSDTRDMIVTFDGRSGAASVGRVEVLDPPTAADK